MCACVRELDNVLPGAANMVESRCVCVGTNVLIHSHLRTPGSRADFIIISLEVLSETSLVEI